VSYPCRHVINNGSRTMRNAKGQSKVGVFIDGENIRRNGGYRMQYDVLRDFACRDGALPQRLNTYLAYDQRRAENDVQYMRRELNFQMSVRDNGYKDGDFVRVISALQSRGIRVEVVACENVSRDLRREADLFLSGYLIPGLVPFSDASASTDTVWGEVGSRVRGICHFHKSGYGFMRYLSTVSDNLWQTDSRDPESPYETVFFNDSDLPSEVEAQALPSREHVVDSARLAGAQPATKRSRLPQRSAVSGHISNQCRRQCIATPNLRSVDPAHKTKLTKMHPESESDQRRFAL